MKRSLSIVFFFLLSLFMLSIFAQANDYPISIINGKEYYFYEVLKGEGLYRVSLKFNISQDEIIANNPEAATGLREGQIIRIPSKNGTKNQVDTIFSSHVVEKGQTLYSISRQYNITPDIILKYNPSAANGIKTGAVLRIPSRTTERTNTPTISPKTKEPRETVAAPKETVSQAIVVPEKKDFIQSSPKNKIRIALLLPLMLDADKQDATIDKFIEFYEGCLLAVNKLKSEGVSVDLYTFDTEKSEAKINEILNNEILKKVDFIIGPAYSNQVNIVENFALQNKVNLIVPFSSKIDDINKNPYVFQNNSPQKIRFAESAKGFAAQFRNKNIIVCRFNSDLDDEGSQFAQFLIPYLKRQQISYQDYFYSQERSVNFSSLLSTNKENIILLATDKPEIIRDMTSVINAMNSRTTPISVFGFSAWQTTLKSFSDVYVSSPFYVNAASSETKDYNKSFNRFFGHEITTSFPRFDMMGYDLTLYFAEAVRTYGKNFGSMLPLLEVKTIQSDFSFQRQGVGGYVNQHFSLIRFNKEKGIEKINIQ